MWCGVRDCLWWLFGEVDFVVGVGVVGYIWLWFVVMGVRGDIVGKFNGY